MTAVAKCTEIPGIEERLQCFDAAAAGVRSVLAEADRQAAEASRKEEEGGGMLAWFGISREAPPVTKPEDFGIAPAKNTRPDAPKEITEISAGVTEFAKTPLGKAIFILDNGQIWRQLDGDSSEVNRRSSDGPSPEPLNFSSSARVGFSCASANTPPRKNAPPTIVLVFFTRARRVIAQRLQAVAGLGPS
jgi:hypothetical protein